MIPGTPLSTIFAASIEQHLEVIRSLGSRLPLLEEVAGRMFDAIRSGGKVLWFGNGGSAADCQHLASELVGRYRRERRGMASIALTTDSSALTSIGNDYGFASIFSRQIEALCLPGDVAIGISTSGNSENVCRALVKAREMGAFTVGMTGASGGRIVHLTDACLCIESAETPRIQEAHILAGHMLCDAIEAAFCDEAVDPARHGE